LRRAMTSSDTGTGQQQPRRSSPRSTNSDNTSIVSPSEDVATAAPPTSPFASVGQTAAAAAGEVQAEGPTSPRSPLTTTQGFGTVAVHLVARAGGGEPAGAVVQCTGPPAEAAEVGCGLDGKVSPELEGAGESMGGGRSSDWVSSNPGVSRVMVKVEWVGLEWVGFQQYCLGSAYGRYTSCMTG
jgi:hypothetical protein